MPLESRGVDQERRDALIATLLSLLTLVLASLRLAGAQGYATYKPIGMRLLEGLPASWEAGYFLAQLPTFLGDVPVSIGIAPVDYRTLVNLYLFAQLYGWTGSAYWSLAAVDVFFWIVATLCTWRLGPLVGLCARGSVAAAVLLAASPIFFTQMWHQDLHLANSASLPAGLWATAAIIHGKRAPLPIGLGLASVLLYLSLTYQFQWFVAPVAFVLLAVRGPLRLPSAIATWSGAVALFLVVTAVLGGIIQFSGLGATGDRVAAVQQPLALLGERVGGNADFSTVVQEMPRVLHVLQSGEAYHPLVYWGGLFGLLTLGLRGAILAALTFLMPLFFMRLYPTPWVMMTAYPMIYLGAGHLCAALGRGARWSRIAITGGSVVVLCALTNRDLWGDASFLLSWWNLYSASPIH